MGDAGVGGRVCVWLEGWVEVEVGIEVEAEVVDEQEGVDQVLSLI